MKKASWWRSLPDGRVECFLCPRLCRLQEGQIGFCQARENVEGSLVTLVYGKPTGFSVDPIEKKPLYHFLPGSSILSFGTYGCNLGCRFCQNWHLSRGRPGECASPPVTPAQVVDLAVREKCPSIAFTYNEPTIFGEFVVDIARLARSRGVRTVLVTAGYVTPEAREDLYRDIDAANVDLKSFRDAFYREQCSARLEPVLTTIEWLVRVRKLWVELTTLLIPGLNDSEAELTELCAWVHDRLGPEVPLHFSAFHPDHLLTDLPATPAATLEKASTIAHARGLRFVYLGNLRGEAGQFTVCPGCGKTVIRRARMQVLNCGLQGAACPHCSTTLPGIFS